ncbi:hypothetical protein [Rhodanobacter sp. C03]|uniref:hypothetical protein n=1 Tax=Rhodanobacter sp. C03 TaxID=1945858 RepID=UPI0011158E9B|nr:hypothetical protein [Rhodanobacter sp. C03]
MRPIVLSDQFFWNLHQSVGKNASNGNSMDISFVQWSFVEACARESGIPAATLQIYRSVRVTGSCSSRDDDPLVAAILAMQGHVHSQRPHTVIDGHISVANGILYAPGAEFLILDINLAIAGWYPNLYPRLDLIPGCPAAIANVSRQAIPRV